jgi:hypothetical protein
MAKQRGSLSGAMDAMRELRAKEAAASADADPVDYNAIPKPTLDPHSGKVDTPKKVKVSLYLDQSLVERARGAVAWAQMRGEEPDSISALATGAFERELVRLLDVLKPDTGDFPHLGKSRKGRPPKG